MALDVFQERGLSDADIRFGDPNYCFFPLFEWIQPLPIQQACILYSIMWAGSIGIMLGLKFRLSCLLYLCPYLYFFLLDKSRWNNHSYLFSLFTMLLTWSGAGQHMSIDALSIPKETKLSGVPKWNYFILKFQIFLLYFYAGVKKLFDSDWINGYSMKNLSKHSVFSPLKLVTDAETIEFYMVHMGGLVYDLTVGFMLNFDFSKKAAYLLSLMFHGLNSQIFHIGMFPYVCLASLVLFCKPGEFPCSLFKTNLEQTSSKSSRLTKRTKVSRNESSSPCKSSSSRATTGLLLFYMLLQLVLPFSHSITQGYNTWTKGLYGYSWDMMINSWETLHQKITVRNYYTGDERYLDTDVWVTNDRWSSHPDMAKQYAGCISRNLARFNITNIEIYMDVWKSLNGRFQQRMYDPRVNILTAPWSPFEEVTWVLPLLRQFSHYRQDHFQRIAKEVSNWTESSDVIFVADFPGLYLENYLPKELGNVSITVLSGQIMIEQDGDPNITLTNTMSAGNDGSAVDDSSNANNGDVLISTKHGIRSAEFHKVHVVSFPNPSCYMYTYTNDTAEKLRRTKTSEENDGESSIISQIWKEIREFAHEKYQEFSTSIYLVANAHLNLFFDVPMVLRKSINSPD
ncbi:Vitamin K-dependent gamma-carboxylase [Orchesella cincta]|uniref:Vitamin K-dependent gamma-carboxylase n=1 Tax=Orchesella cincta TaxID=48709 RepID=A0A1D2MT85_ORCCI|nr:Vitamin K-dependent gamma-carboxylase [Orchesella cincta]